MGNITSLHNDPKPSSRFNSRGEKAIGRLDLKEVSDLGSRDEIFFDSKAWIDSDCEDDFYSVRGDLTPSRGSTPVHPSSIQATSLAKKPLFDENPPTPSEPSPRKKLSQLLLETSKEEKAVGKGGGGEAASTTPTAAANDTPSKSPISSEKNKVNGVQKSPRLKNGKVKNDHTMQCCLPNGLSIHQWKKHRTSPMHQNYVGNGIKTSAAAP